MKDAVESHDQSNTEGTIYIKRERERIYLTSIEDMNRERYPTNSKM